MNHTYATQNADMPETRAVDQSLIHAHDGIQRCIDTYERIRYAVTGFGGPADAAAPLTPSALVDSADLLAGRIEGLSADLERLYARISAPNIKSLGPDILYRGEQSAAAKQFG